MVAVAAAAEQGMDVEQLSSVMAGSNDSPYQGLDLNYILSVSNTMGGGGFGAEKRGSDAWSGKMSVGSSVAAHEAREHRDRQPSWADGWSIGRRQSTATVNEDTFIK